MCQEGFSWVGPGEENARKGDGQAPLTTVFVQARAATTPATDLPRRGPPFSPQTLSAQLGPGSVRLGERARVSQYADS